MRVLMLVATSLAFDTRVLREATTLAEAGHAVHVIGRQVPTGWTPPAGVTVSSVDPASPGSLGAPSGRGSPGGPGGRAPRSRRRLAPASRVARWALLPAHRNRVFGRWARGAELDGADRGYDVVHAHDFTALEAGAWLARLHGVPLVYDSHELWSGRPRVGRPTPLQARRERRVEAELGARAAAVITVGDGVAEALRTTFRWQHVHVVRNTFPQTPVADLPPALPTAAGLVYAGRLAPYRELETIAAASRRISLPITLVGPADETWLAAFDPGRAAVERARSVVEVDELLATAGLALVTHSDRWANHRLAMPNKLFHAVRVGVPVIATDVGELARVVREHALGELYPPGDDDGLVRAVQRAVARYADLSAAVRIAAPALSWESDAVTLLRIYATLGKSP